ncbi:MAG TPA: hypothetical protein DCL41_09940 [Bdellovibrionales bacterium]|nr:hypothetical protein [Pseudobdellovibrionaceae bacterium]HAG92184.1 hypothetical protein [Bdellovibrionales bacterium]|tara:strand:- start:1081 stop:1845 length:765 start_codon:yes stop_codon:yes gene_type:complete
MKNHKSLLGILGVAIAITLLFGFFKSKNSDTTSKRDSKENKSTVSSQVSQAPLSALAKPQTKIVRSGKKASLVTQSPNGKMQSLPLTPEEESLVQMTQFFAEFAGTLKNEKDFARELLKLGLKPTIARDRQDLIEDLSIVRTKNTLPGVRYIHGQFDGDESQELQHLSFEIPKGPNALSKGMTLVLKTLSVGKRIPNTDPKMILFKKDGYVIWLKELTWEDMMNDPFNAYTKKDVGNIRVAIERDIHDHESHGG